MSDEEDEDAEVDQLSPAFIEKLTQEKLKNPTKFPSYWEEDEADIVRLIEQDIENNPKERVLWAGENNHIDVLEEILISQPQLVNTSDSDGYTPLHRACYNGHSEAVEYLLLHGANIRAKTEDGWEPLHSAVKWNHVTIADILLQNGANINIQTNGGQTGLHLAASNKDSTNMLQLLLMKKDIDTNIRNNAGDTASEVGVRTSDCGYLFEIGEDSINSL